MTQTKRTLPPIVAATLQSAVLSATSNLLAQALTAYKANVSWKALIFNLGQLVCPVSMTEFESQSTRHGENWPETELARLLLNNTQIHPSGEADEPKNMR